MSFGYNVLGFGSLGGSRISTITLNITSNTSEYNILTAANSAGYDAPSGQPVVVNVSNNATVSASSSYAMRTGALGADSDLTINVESGSAITGFNGSTPSAGSGSAGGTGGDGIFFETSTGGSGTYTVTNGGTVSGGGGGGGGGGRQGCRRPLVYNDQSKTNECTGPAVCGPQGSNGGAGAVGNAGSAGGNGSYGGGHDNCITQTPTNGGAGGAAGFAVRKNSRTVTIAGGGTYNGSTA